MGLISFILHLGTNPPPGSSSTLITTDSEQHTIDTTTLYTIDNDSTTT